MKTTGFAALAVLLLGAGVHAAEPVPELAERLSCKDEPVRYALAAELTRAASAGGGAVGELAGALEKLFGDPSARIRTAAAIGIGNLGDAKLLPLLRKAAATGDSSLLLAITNARKALEDTRVADDLERMLKGDAEPQGLAAARVMATAGDAEMLRRVVAAAQDRSAAVRTRAFFGLGFSRYRGTMDAIGLGLSDADAKARQVAIDALGRRRARGEPIAQSVVMIMREDDSPAVRRAAANTLGLMLAQSAVEGLKLALQKDEDASVRVTAATSLGSLRADAARETLLETARRDETVVRAAALNALSRYRAKDLVREFVSLLKDPEARVRYAALGCLAQFGKDDLGEAEKSFAMILTTDPDARCRASAAFVLPKLGAREHFVLLVDAAGDPDPAVRTNAAAALAKTQKRGERADVRVADVLVKLLDDKAASVRGAAVQQCGRLGVKAAVEKAAALVRSDPDATVRARAAKALKSLGRTTTSVPALLDALGDSSGPVRAAAAAGLRSISGKRFGFGTYDAPSRRAKAIEAWKRWWQSQIAFPIGSRQGPRRGGPSA